MLRFFKKECTHFFQNIKGVYEEEEEEKNKKKRRNKAKKEDREIEDSGTHFCLDFLAH